MASKTSSSGSSRLDDVVAESRRERERREQGYRETMAAAGLPVPDGYVDHAPHVRGAAREVAARVLDRPDRPTAVFASSDTQALGVLEAARAAGLAVPGDLSVVGFDDIEVSGYAGLTTVRQPLYESGRLAARLLLDVLEGRAEPEPGEHRLELELVERTTTAPPGRRDTFASRGRGGGHSVRDRVSEER